MNLRRALIIVALGAVVVASACGSASAAAATVNGRDIDRSEFERELKALRDNKQLAAAGGDSLKGTGKDTVSAELSAGWLTALIYDAVITEEFEDRKLDLTKDDREAGEAQLGTQFGNPTVAADFPDWFRKRLVDRNARAIAVRNAIVGFSSSDEGLRKYFTEHEGDFAQACLSHILVKEEAEAKAVAARLKAGEDFAAVAKEVSTDPGSKPQGGDLDCNPKGVFVTAFEDAAFAAEVGKATDPVKTDFGYHLILVRERKTASFDESRDKIIEALNTQSQSEFREFLEKAMGEAEVTVDSRFGKFESEGPDQAPQVVPPEKPAPADERGTTTTTSPGGTPPPGLEETPGESTPTTGG
ncbi:MAG TPA: peptidylprolyl isomerase [Acidimicrobiia bacterium]|nr:peptidylprolyl isomerase [Acidimicrobiia bacterium]